MANAADRKDIRVLEKLAKVAEQQRADTVRSIMSTELGRRYLWERLEAAHVFQISFADDPMKMAFREGERNQGILLLNDLMQSCPEDFILAMREANGRRSSDDLRANADTAGSDTGERPGGEEPGRVDQGSASDATGGYAQYVHDEVSGNLN